MGMAAPSRPMNDPLDDKALVAFDFDGTMTVRDSFTAFLAWRVGRARYTLGVLKLTPAILSYLGHRDRGRLKAAAVVQFLKGVPLEKVEAEAKIFAETHATRLLRPDAVATWKRWRARGARAVIVTASPETIVAPFARGLGADALIGTQLEVNTYGQVSGAFTGSNCRGAEKVRRLQEMFGEDVHLAAAYGDTDGDKEMLSIADEKGYRVFIGKPGGRA